MHFCGHHILLWCAALSLGSVAISEAGPAAAIAAQGAVVVRGTVDHVLSPRQFVLRDGTKDVAVNIESNQSLMMQKGSKVTVKGTVANDSDSISIHATSVEVAKGAIEGLSDVVQAIPGIAAGSVDAYDIRNVPADGVVKVTGVVTQVHSKQEFTIRDQSGQINVDVPRSQSAAFVSGAEVTVIGLVGQDAVGKDIDARKIIVIGDARS